MHPPTFDPPGGVALWIPIPSPGKAKLMLGCDYSVRVGLLSVTVPENFACDGASIPRLLKLMFPEPTLLLIEASALVHDYLYFVQPCTRFQADAAFRSVMNAYGVPSWASTACYSAVRIFAGGVWKRRSKDVDANRRAFRYDSKTEGLVDETP